MRKVCLLILLCTPMVYADLTLLPESTHYQGQNAFTEVLNDGRILSGFLEFAVYDTEEQWEDLGLEESYSGPRYIYAYQVFNTSYDSTVALTYFELQGLNPDTIASVEEDIDSAETLGSYDSYGLEPSDQYFTDEKTEGIWEFSNGVLIQGETSWFMLIFSDSDWIVGDYAVSAAANDDIPVPGTVEESTNGSQVPEPATLIMLLSGAVLSLKRKKAA